MRPPILGSKARVSRDLTWTSDILQVLLDTFVKVVQRFQLSTPSEEHVALEPPWQPRAGLVRHEMSRWHGEDVIELFEGSLFGFWHEEENHDQGTHVEATVRKINVS
jgi:hypothetical protein